MHPESLLELSGHWRRSTLDAEVRYQPGLTVRLAVVVPLDRHEEPAVQGTQVGKTSLLTAVLLSK